MVLFKSMRQSKKVWIAEWIFVAYCSPEIDQNDKQTDLTSSNCKQLDRHSVMHLTIYTFTFILIIFFLLLIKYFKTEKQKRYACILCWPLSNHFKNKEKNKNTENCSAFYSARIFFLDFSGDFFFCRFSGSQYNNQLDAFNWRKKIGKVTSDVVGLFLCWCRKLRDLCYSSRMVMI